MHISYSGDFNWVIKPELLDIAMDYLVWTMKGWERCNGDTSRSPMLVLACSYGLCNIAVHRDQVLVVDITLKHLEAADGCN